VTLTVRIEVVRGGGTAAVITLQATSEDAVGGSTLTSAARRVWAAVRIGLGAMFLWAFADKAFALGYPTGRSVDPSTGMETVDYFGGAAWLFGFGDGSPTFAFLTFQSKGWFIDTFQSTAGEAWADWLFMAGLLFVGFGFLLGIGLRIGAIVGATMLVLHFLASPATAVPLGSEPYLDIPLITALTLVGLALINAGDTWGLGHRWERASLVEKYPILR
jgi:thiosulfate dehydrogenase [quinone] large subunit